MPCSLPLAILACATLFPLAVHAAERVHLTNGFDVDCTRSEPIDAAHLRLYLTGTNYLDIATTSIRSIEQTPDLSQTPSFQPAPERLNGAEGGVEKPASPSATSSSASPTELHELLTTAGQAHSIDLDLLISVMHTESNGNPHAVSRTGARGLMQLMPTTATQLGVKDSFAPGENLQGGSAYLDQLLTRYHENLALALAAYNAGPAAVDRYHGIPPYRETQLYVARVIREFNRRKLASNTLLTSTKGSTTR